MTETGRLFGDSFEPRQISIRAFGRAPKGELEAKVVDETGVSVPAGETGELWVRCAGPNPRHGFFSGYLKDPAATEQAWQGGWFHTGDIVRQLPDGMLVFVDRKKNIIRRAGENIAAAEVEAALLAHPGVKQAAVIAVPDEIREEEVMACIVPMPGLKANLELAKAIFNHCMETLAYYKAPGWILFRDSLPTTGTQKIQKTALFPPGSDPRQSPQIFDLRDVKKRK